jgi:hypothetical protein
MSTKLGRTSSDREGSPSESEPGTAIARLRTAIVHLVQEHIFPVPTACISPTLKSLPKPSGKEGSLTLA